MSSIIFTLVVDVVSSMISRIEEVGLIAGCAMGREKVRILICSLLMIV